MIFFSGFWSRGAYAEGALSLSEALAKVRTQNLEVRAAREQIQAEEDKYQAAVAKFLPRLDLEAKYTHLDEPVELDLSNIRSAIIGSGQTAATVTGGAAAGATTANSLNTALPPFRLAVQKQNYANAALSLTQPIFAGGKLVANKEARAGEYAISKEESAETEERLILSAAQSYLSVNLAELNLNVRNEVLKGLAEHQAISAKLLGEGQITKIAKMNADLKVKEAEANRIKATHDRDLSRRALSLLLNEELGSRPLKLEMNKNYSIEPREDYLRKARTLNKNLKIAHMRADLLEQKSDAIRADALPSVFGFGRYELYRQDLTALEPKWVVGVGLRMNLYAGGETRDSLASVQAERKAVGSRIEAAEKGVDLLVEKAYSDLLSAREQLGFYDSAVLVAEESLKLNRAAFQSGTVRSIEVTDAYNTYEQTKLAQLKCLIDYNLAYFQLKRAAGEVDASLGGPS